MAATLAGSSAITADSNPLAIIHWAGYPEISDVILISSLRCSGISQVAIERAIIDYVTTPDPIWQAIIDYVTTSDPIWQAIIDYVTTSDPILASNHRLRDHFRPDFASSLTRTSQASSLCQWPDTHHAWYGALNSFINSSTDINRSFHTKRLTNNVVSISSGLKAVKAYQRALIVFQRTLSISDWSLTQLLFIHVRNICKNYCGTVYANSRKKMQILRTKVLY